MAASINLLPEVRVIKIQAGQRKRLYTTITITVGLVVVGIIAGLLVTIGFYAAESARLKSEAQNLQNDVNKSKAMELDAATLQEHLSSWSGLNNQRVSGSAVFSQLVKTIPPDISVTSFQLTTDYVATISGSAPSYKSLGVFAKALEDYNVTFKPQNGIDHKAVFTDVAISQSAKDTTGSKVTYTMSFKVDKSVVESTTNQSP